MATQYQVPTYTPSGDLHDAEHRTLASEEFVNNALQDFQADVDLVRTNLLVQSFINVGTVPATSSSFTPPSDSLLVVAQEGANPVGTSGVLNMTMGDSEGLEWTQQVFSQSDELSDGDYATGLKIWTAQVGEADSMVLVMDCELADIDHFAISVVAYEGYDKVHPIGAKGSFFTSTAGPSGPVSLSLPASVRHSSEVFAVATANDWDSAGGVVPGVGWTEVHDLGGLNSWGVLQTQVRRSTRSSAVTWNNINASGTGHFGYALGAIEVRAGEVPLPLSEMPPKTTIVINKSGGVWPGVPTTRPDIVVVWKGALPAPATVTSRTIDQPGMLQGVDMGLFF